MSSPAKSPAPGDSQHVVAQVWPDLHDDEVARVLTAYDTLRGPVRIGTRSTRPLSSAALVATADRVVFVKRHHSTVRSAEALTEEHTFIDHLRRNDLSTPQVLTTADGRTSVVSPDGAWVYEVLDEATGVDRYRGRDTWSPFDTEDDAEAAGRALGRLHLAAAGFAAPQRRPAVLQSRLALFGASDPVAAIADLARTRPAIGDYLQHRDLATDLRQHLARAAALHPYLAGQPSTWTHNDWHASNLLWAGADVASVIDFGLSDRSYPVYDIAVALERNTLPWPGLLAGNGATPVIEHAAALLRGYQRVRPLSAPERRTLPLVLPLAQADAARHALDYYWGVLGNRAMADWGYDDFLLGHTNWFSSAAGEHYLGALEDAVS